MNTRGEPWTMKEPTVSSVGLESNCLDAVHAGRRGMEWIGRWLVWRAGSVPAQAVPAGCVSVEAELNSGCAEGTFGQRQKMWESQTERRKLYT